MICRITDEQVYNPWEQDLTEEEMDRRQMLEEEARLFCENIDMIDFYEGWE